VPGFAHEHDVVLLGELADRAEAEDGAFRLELLERGEVGSEAAEPGRFVGGHRATIPRFEADERQPTSHGFNDGSEG